MTISCTYSESSYVFLLAVGHSAKYQVTLMRGPTQVYKDKANNNPYPCNPCFQAQLVSFIFSSESFLKTRTKKTNKYYTSPKKSKASCLEFGVCFTIFYYSHKNSSLWFEKLIFDFKKLKNSRD